MAKKGKLLAALDVHKGRDHKLEQQKKFQKQAAKKKRSKAIAVPSENPVDYEHRVVSPNGVDSAPDAEAEGWESDESVAAEPNTIGSIGLLDDESGSESSLSDENTKNPVVEDSDLEEADEEEISLSDIESLASEDKADILPHQRLTIYNTSALQKAHTSIALPYTKIPFPDHQAITTSEPVSIHDVNDDLSRELAFYKQCLDAANQGRSFFKKEGVPFSRPNDYFAEMVKSDEHMGKIRQKIGDEAASKKAASEARRQRDLKKFGKQVQVAKLQERDKAKRETLDKINLLRKKRKNTEAGATAEDDLFDVALEDAAKENIGNTPNKRRKRNEKYGYGGKKRFSKSGDAASSANMTAFSARKMKSQQKNSQRLGKSRRAKLP